MISDHVPPNSFAGFLVSSNVRKHTPGGYISSGERYVDGLTTHRQMVMPKKRYVSVLFAHVPPKLAAGSNDESHARHTAPDG